MHCPACAIAVPVGVLDPHQDIDQYFLDERALVLLVDDVEVQLVDGHEPDALGQLVLDGPGVQLEKGA